MINEQKIKDTIKEDFPIDPAHFFHYSDSDVWTEGFLVGVKFTENQMPDILKYFILFCWKKRLSLNDLVIDNNDKLFKDFETYYEARNKE